MSAALARPEIAMLQPYRTAVQQADTVRLNANEAPASPLDNDLNRYPPIRPRELQEKLASLYKVKRQQLLVTRGSSDAIDLLVRTFCRAYRDSVVVLPPTFSMYETYARMQGAQVIDLALDKSSDFAVHSEQVLARCDDTCKLVFVCSPNNPTGASTPFAEIEKLLAARAGKSLIVVDEAYIEFSPHGSLADRLEHHDNLVILRTLSKAWGLAGARCGAVLASPAIIEVLGRMAPPYAFPAPSVAQIQLALSEQGQEHARQLVAAIVAERERMRPALDELACVTRIWPSDGNFLLVRFESLATVQRRLQDRGILIRAFDDCASLRDCARITIGSPAENELLLAALADIAEAVA